MNHQGKGSSMRLHRNNRLTRSAGKVSKSYSRNNLKNLLGLAMALLLLVNATPFTRQSAQAADAHGSPSAIISNLPISPAPTASISNGDGLMAVLGSAVRDQRITIAGEEWIVVRVSGAGDSRALLLAKIQNRYTGNYGSSNNYSGSAIQGFCTSFYTSWTSPLKDLALVPTLGDNTSTTVLTSPYSNPQLQQMTLASTTSQTTDIVFIMSVRDMIEWNDGEPVSPVRDAIRNVFPQASDGAHVWLRTKGTGNTIAWELNNRIEGPGYIADAANVNASQATRVPAVWVKASDVWRTVAVNYITSDGQPLIGSYPQTYRVPYDGSISLDETDAPFYSGYGFTDNWRLGAADAADQAMPARLDNLRADTAVYLVYGQTSANDIQVTLQNVESVTGSLLGSPGIWTESVAFGEGFSLDSQEIQHINGYNYTGWRVGPVGARRAPDMPVILGSLTEDTTIQLIYEKDIDYERGEINAFVNGSPSATNGSFDFPILVARNSVIEYTITTTNEITEPGFWLTAVADQVPEGLEIVPGSISPGGVYNPFSRVILWENFLQPNESVTVSFSATVMQDATLFANRASFVFGDSSEGDSNTTYHRSAAASVTEYFRELGDEGHILDASLDSNIVELAFGDPYTPRPGIPPESIIDGGVNYAYYGFRVDGGDIDITPWGSFGPFLIDVVNEAMEITYLYMPRPVKNAFLNGSPTADNGTAESPVLVDPGDIIRYEIELTNERKITVDDPVKYDILFVLDWSESMEAWMFWDIPESARQYERDVMLDMFDFITIEYPDSRVSVMALNAQTGLTNNPVNTFIQFETDFLTPEDYWDKGWRGIIDAAFNEDPRNTTEDLASFMRAARQKMSGLVFNYGNANIGGAKDIIPRKGDDLDERIPVIVFISDFQIPRSQSIGSSNYWTSVFKNHVDNYAQVFPNGILQTVRFDHRGNHSGGNVEYATEYFDRLMMNNISPAGRAGWGFTKVELETDYTTALQLIKDDFTSLVPSVDKRGVLVTDFVPAGLIVNENSIMPAGSYNSLMHTVSWDLSEEEDGPITLSFDVTVGPGDATYVNVAALSYVEGYQTQTNATYHSSIRDVTVTDYFREQGNEGNILDSHDGNEHLVHIGDPYYHDSDIPPGVIELGGVTYIYYGYRIDDGQVDWTLHSLLPDIIIPTVLEDTDVTFLYVRQPIKEAFIDGSLVAQNGSAMDFEQVRRGQQIEYVITIDNKYIDEFTLLSSFTLFDVIPAGLSYLSHTDSNGSIFHMEGSVCIWQWFDCLPVGETSVSVTVTVDWTVVQPAFVNFATLFFSNVYSIDTTYTFHELFTLATLDFTKVDESDVPMELVAFNLYECTDVDPSSHMHDEFVADDGSSCWGLMMQTVSDEYGLVVFQDFPAGKYMLVEVGTRAGYQLPSGQWLIEVDDSFVITSMEPLGYNGMVSPPAFRPSSGGDRLLLPNFPNPRLPMTGGITLVVMTAVGIVLIGAGAIYAVMPRIFRVRSRWVDKGGSPNTKSSRQ